ncbi:mitotic checkpoint regulator, MAD2B-interacting-domain-containing protein [Glomus cerebriforme]|uniref:Mitotic checkpoint regulator, MAD2B-interacting-domain-containing protein n=1 Tax=Glomus cerebriforme TaxID=658196 RepID=A0A397TDZ9_9GLOM|nr:mitotic checkpoint regulator, MAD2B-interacting-domain-containing protein [Glomus cerebriforme]
MSLVADYGSDISGSDEENNIQNVIETTTTTKPSLTSLLPAPKSKRNGPVKIVVDLPKPGNDDDDDSDKEQTSKKSKPVGSGLFALLPPPKRPVTGKEQKSSTNKPMSDLSTIKPITASTSFVPHTLTKRKSTTTHSFSKIKGKEIKVQGNENETKDTTENNKFTESFFPLGAEITNITPSKAIEDESFKINNSDKIESSNIESNANYNATNDYNYNYNYNYQWDAGTNSYMEYPGYYYDESQLQQQNSEQAQPDSHIDDEAIQKLGGRRGKEGPIVIKEINAADQMADAWQAQMSELTKPGKVGSGGTHLKPTKGQKRKHNLMYLAYQAAAMENDLKEQFAANKKTKRETQAKYGYYDLIDFNNFNDIR